MKTSFFLLLCMGLIAISSCTKNDDSPEEQKTLELDEKSTKLVKASNEFGLELFQRIYESETEYDNIMVSPLSISLALAMTYNGAKGDTQTAMENTLKVNGLTSEEINQSYKTLVEALKSLDEKVVMEIANAIFYREGFSVENNFITTNENYYDAEIDALDFDSPNALNTINDWVDAKTHGKINKIINNISPDHVMFLLNAIYFNGIWKNEFDKDETQNLPFYLNSTGSSIEVPTMQKTDVLSYASNNVFSAVKMAYGIGNYNMYVFLPNEDNSIEDIVQEFTQSNWATWMDSFADSVKVDIKLPQLKYEYEIKLNKVLCDMGMEIAFGGGANFTGINKNGNLNIDYVKHKTFIDVNEEGTEAAAVTVVAIEYTSAGSQNTQFSVNRPFFYAITEKDTDAILFMGTVKNPKQED